MGRLLRLLRSPAPLVSLAAPALLRSQRLLSSPKSHARPAHLAAPSSLSLRGRPRSASPSPLAPVAFPSPPLPGLPPLAPPAVSSVSLRLSSLLSVLPPSCCKV